MNNVQVANEERTGEEGAVCSWALKTHLEFLVAEKSAPQILFELAWAKYFLSDVDTAR